MKRITLRSIKTKGIVKTFDVEDENVQGMCDKISMNAEYGAVLIDYEFEITDIAEDRVAALQYLEETEWCFIRFLEVGVKVPAAIAKKRKEAWKVVETTKC